MKNESAYALVFRLGMIPMFLFSGAFFPIANLNPVMEWLARVTPLWHGVDLTRMLVLGDVDGGLRWSTSSTSRPSPAWAGGSPFAACNGG